MFRATDQRLTKKRGRHESKTDLTHTRALEEDSWLISARSSVQLLSNGLSA
jgi:hypothetical protein